MTEGMPKQQLSLTVEELISIIGQKEVELIATRELDKQRDEEINVLKKKTK